MKIVEEKALGTRLATVIYGFHPLGGRFPELKSKLKRLDKTILLTLVQLRTQEQAFN